MGMSARSIIVAGMSAAVVGAAAVTPVSTPAMSPARIDAAFQMTSITAPLEAAIKNTYNAVQPWVAYGVNWADYLLGFIPFVGGIILIVLFCIASTPGPNRHGPLTV